MGVHDLVGPLFEAQCRTLFVGAALALSTVRGVR